MCCTSSAVTPVYSAFKETPGIPGHKIVFNRDYDNNRFCANCECGWREERKSTSVWQDPMIELAVRVAKHLSDVTEKQEAQEKAREIEQDLEQLGLPVRDLDL
jgi:hypothetical protein